MSNSRKKVIVRRFAGDSIPGYMSNSGIVRSGVLELLDLSGRIQSLALNDVKMVSFVRDFNLSDSANPERLIRRTFLSRPRTEGLWLRLTFRSGDLMEGLAATDLSLLDALVEDAGLYLTPPDIRSNTQRIYIPHLAIAEIHLLAVVTSPSHKKPISNQESKEKLQNELFHMPFDPDSRPN